MCKWKCCIHPPIIYPSTFSNLHSSRHGMHLASRTTGSFVCVSLPFSLSLFSFSLVNVATRPGDRKIRRKKQKKKWCFLHDFHLTTEIGSLPCHAPKISTQPMSLQSSFPRFLDAWELSTATQIVGSPCRSPRNACLACAVVLRKKYIVTSRSFLKNICLTQTHSNAQFRQPDRLYKCNAISTSVHACKQ